jgi:Cytochrome C oxidase, cbb3-type, subunit III
MVLAACGRAVEVGGEVGVRPPVQNPAVVVDERAPDASVSVPDASVALPKPEDPVIPNPGCVVAQKQAPVGPLTPEYQRYCSECHGADGLGSKGMPSLKGVSMDRMKAYARSGSAQKMPSFDPQMISEDQLARTVASLSKVPVTYSAEEACQVPNVVPTDAEITRDGLAAAREPDSKGYACVHCHSPDLFDLAYFTYDEGTLSRRALLHVDEKKSKRIFRYVALLRKQLSLQTVSPGTRVFQPGGGEPLACSSPEECDHVFGVALLNRVPSLKTPINTLAQAKQFKSEFVGLHPRDMPIGMGLNRWTEDAARGAEHASMNEWIPDFSYLPTSPANAAATLRLHDAYIANPSWDTLRPILKSVDMLSEVPASLMITEEAKQILKDKYKSVLVGAHLLRLQSRGTSLTSLPAFVNVMGFTDPTEFFNPMWSVGDSARILDSGFSPVDAAKFSAEQKSRLSAPLGDEIANLRLSWFWIGFLFDPGVMHSGGSNSTKSTEYFNMQMYERHYYNHVSYMRFQKAFSQAFRPGLTLRTDGKQQLASASAQVWNYFLSYDNGRVRPGYESQPNLWKMPAMGERRDLFLNLQANLTRALALLMADEAARLGVDDKAPLQGAIGWMRDWMSKDFHRVSFATPGALTGQAKIDAEMLNAMDAAINAACDNRPLRYKEVVFPGHCSYVP